MKCFVCNNDSPNGVNGPNGLYICIRCVEGMSDLEGVVIAGKCSWCDEEIGTVKGELKERTVLAVAADPTGEIILCSECGKLCIDICAEI